MSNYYSSSVNLMFFLRKIYLCYSCLETRTTETTVFIKKYTLVLYFVLKFLPTFFKKLKNKDKFYLRGFLTTLRTHFNRDFLEKMLWNGIRDRQIAGFLPSIDFYIWIPFHQIFPRNLFDRILFALNTHLIDFFDFMLYVQSNQYIWNNY